MCHHFYLKGACVRFSRDVKLRWYFLFCFDGQLHCFHFFRVNCTANRLVSMHRLVTEAWHTQQFYLTGDKRRHAARPLRRVCLSDSFRKPTFCVRNVTHFSRIDWLIDGAGGGARGQLQGPFINSVLTGVWCGALKQAGGSVSSDGSWNKYCSPQWNTVISILTLLISSLFWREL